MSDPGRGWRRRSALGAAISLVGWLRWPAEAAKPGVVPAVCANWKLAHDAIGFYFPTRGAFYLQDSDDSEFIEAFAVEKPSSQLIAIAGDWTGGGFDSVGLYDPASSEFRLHYEAGSGTAGRVFRFGTAGSGAVPVAGRWTGKGPTTVGLFEPRSGRFHLRNANADGPADLVLPFGEANDKRIPIAGDWVGDGVTRVGLFDSVTSRFHLRLSNDPADRATRAFQFGGGNSGWLPVIGKWQAASRTDDVGLHKNNAVILRYALEGGKGDRTMILAPQGTPGGAGPQVIVGRWKPSHCRSAGENTSPKSPDWAKHLILYELRIETFTEGARAGTFVAAAEKLPELQQLGVTGIVLDPVENGPTAPDLRRSNLFGPSMPDKINARLGTPEDFRVFVDRAHRLGIRVIVNNVLHGLVPSSPYVGPGPMAFPPDWFGRMPDGKPAMTYWGTVQLDWTSPGLRAWWIEKIGVGWVQQFDIDGFRMDLEPATAGTPLWEPLREAVLSRTGKSIVLMPELATSGRGYTYDMAQNNVLTADFYEGRRNVVDFVKSAPEVLYTSGLSNHDSHAYFADGRLGAFAYGALLAPFIPYWFAGEEFDAAADFFLGSSQGVLYFSQLHRKGGSASAGFGGQVRKLIAIRRAYKHVIAPLDRPLRQTNITKVARYSGTDLEPYVMWDQAAAIVVVASHDGPSRGATVAIPAEALPSARASYEVTNLLTNATMAYTRAGILGGLSFPLARGGVAPLLVTPSTR